MGRTYLCIDLKSFYASVEAVERGLDPMTTNLVVADPERSENTICLAITPAMKALGVKNRCRIRDIPSNIDYITATPRMQKYIDYSAEIYSIYLRYISKDDIHVYSVDEAFLDVTEYLNHYHLDGIGMAKMLMDEVFRETGIRATCGVGTNLYLAKVALDILAKHSPDFIAYLDEQLYQEKLWNHRPLTDFWRIGPGIAKRLEEKGLCTMGSIAKCSGGSEREFHNEDLLYKMFGIDAELLIDHAWGREPVTIKDIKAYKPNSSSLSSGQVLLKDYTAKEARIVLTEMLDSLCLDLVEKNLLTSSVTIQIGYSHNEACPPARGTVKLTNPSSADKTIIPLVTALYDRIIDRDNLIRRVTISFNGTILADSLKTEQLSLFEMEDAAIQKEQEVKNKKLQEAVLNIKDKYGKNAILKGLSFTDGATGRERNLQIGGHKG